MTLLIYLIVIFTSLLLTAFLYACNFCRTKILLEEFRTTNGRGATGMPDIFIITASRNYRIAYPETVRRNPRSERPRTRQHNEVITIINHNQTPPSYIEASKPPSYDEAVIQIPAKF